MHEKVRFNFQTSLFWIVPPLNLHLMDRQLSTRFYFACPRFDGDHQIQLNWKPYVINTVLFLRTTPYPSGKLSDHPPCVWAMEVSLVRWVRLYRSPAIRLDHFSLIVCHWREGKTQSFKDCDIVWSFLLKRLACPCI